MGLQDLNEQLYNREHAADRETVDILTPEEEVSHLEIDGEAWKPVTHRESVTEKTGFWWADHQRMIFSTLALLAILGASGFFGFRWYKTFFSEEHVTAQVSIAAETKSGETLPVKVHVENANRTSLENVEVVLEYPESFVAEMPYEGWKVTKSSATLTLGTLAGGAQKDVAINGKIFATKGTAVPVKVSLRYSPQKISGEYTAVSEASTRVSSSPFFVEVLAPLNLVTGQPLDYQITYRNESNQTLDNVRLKAEFPEGFTFQNANPPSTSRDVWLVGTFRPGDTGKIVVRGILTGVYNENKEVKVTLGYEAGSGEFVTYNQGSSITKITASPLSVVLLANNQKELTANAGDILSYAVQYQNNGEQGLRDIIVSTTFEHPEFLDWQNLDLPRGAFDEATKTLVWRAADIPELKTLAPGQKGEVTFTVPVIGDFSGKGVIKNATIVAKTTIDSPDIQSSLAVNRLVGSNTLQVKLGTLVGFQVFGYHQDDTLHNDGPVPPVVGKKTQYTLRLKVSNPINDVTNAKVALALPGYMKFTGAKTPDGESLEYKDRTNELVWNIGSMTPGTTRELRAQIEFSPSSPQADKDFLMMLGAQLTAQDSFAKEAIVLNLGEKNSSLSEDTSLPPNASRVKAKE
jgi:uncharacterized repeat protein (TIGR01451 family)